ncbi:hypothetical protein MGYG_03682 [Nannizzia gypsea CBS 118893]|uniref:BAR domain-containing protein n=1 Tax=Arthroderma gypseum (strain ATCC MYA-4604 / CBS 118893) TaxID=535722 RepID=E4UTB6_ARTGP|nr:hypothetical protein MGYG_03682 [Nannizzia gypsea CBS 118893]EFR00677.1 hypothetical protein MGYG_03682 [Nannizzia gypsea CBS 118893]
MNVNKKLGRLKQWAGERMGGEIKTNVSDDFKMLEMEMNLRQEGMERLNRAMAAPTQQFNSYGRRATLTRSNTSFNEHTTGEDMYRTSSQQQDTPRSREATRPALGSRQPTFEGPTQLRTSRKLSPSPAPALRTPLRTASDTISPAIIGNNAAGIANARSQLRVVSQGYNGGGGNDGYYDSTTDEGTSPVRNSPDQYYSSTSTSPLRTVPASGQVPTAVFGSGSGTATPMKKAPPPPPPSRSKKPPPPPPPPKRSVSAYAA